MNRLSLLLGSALFILQGTAHAALPTPAKVTLSSHAQARIEAQIALVAQWASDPIIVDAVRAQNAGLPATLETLDQEKWHSYTNLDPVVRGVSRSPVGLFLCSKRSAVIGEAFVSDAAGFKVGFITKPSNWCHAGKPKHEQPMAGKTWQGRLEFDESTGLRLIQISVPVLDAGKPIGSLVVGLSTAFLSEE